MTGLIALNLMMAIVWGAMQGAGSAWSYAVGFLIGFLILSLGEPEYGRRTLAAASYVLFLFWQIARSAVIVARALVARRDATAPAIVAVPTRTRTAAELLILASSITLTPGTISVETGVGPGGERVIFVHALQGEDPAALCADIRDQFEARIFRFTRERTWGGNWNRGTGNKGS